MTGILQLLALVVVAVVATYLLERGGRLGYGWVTGSEFLVAGMLLGPVGLDVVSADLVADAHVLVVIAAAWMGIRVGLRLTRTEIAQASVRSVIASQLEPMLALLVLRGLLEGTRHFLSFPGSSWDAWLFAAVGATSTKSAIAWVKSRHRANGPVTDALGVISDLNDLPSVFLLGVLFAFRPELASGHATPPLWLPPMNAAAIALVLTALIALATAVLVLLVVGRRDLRVDLAWVALLGACALLAGAAEPLGLRGLVMACFFGILLGIMSPHRDAFEELTRPSERPVIQVLLLLGGASIPLLPGALIAGLLFGILRLFAKGIGGFFVGVFLQPGGKRVPQLGLALFAGGGMAFALALSASQSIAPETGAAVLSGTAAMMIMGDLLGAPTLRWVLRRNEEVPLPPPAEVSSP